MKVEMKVYRDLRPIFRTSPRENSISRVKVERLNLFVKIALLFPQTVLRSTISVLRMRSHSSNIIQNVESRVHDKAVHLDSSHERPFTAQRRALIFLLNHIYVVTPYAAIQSIKLLFALYKLVPRTVSR